MLKDVSEALLSLQDEAIPSTSTSTCDMHRGHINENRTNIVNHDQSDTICTGTGSDMNQNVSSFFSFLKPAKFCPF